MEETLPPEIWEKVLAFTPVELTQLLALVCSGWSALCARRPKSTTSDAILRLWVREQCTALLIWTRAQGRRWTPALCTEAARQGNVAMLEWLHAEGCEWDAGTAAGAAGCDQFPTLQWLHASGCILDCWVHAEAAGAGNMQMLCWLKEKGCPTTPVAFARAAEEGHMEVLEWLLTNGCGWRPSATYAAAAGAGRLNILQWLYDHHCPFGDDLYNCPYERAALEGQASSMQWLHERRCRPASAAKACTLAATQGHLPALQWLLANTSVPDWGHMTILTHATLHGHEHILKWLGGEGYSVGEGECNCARELGHTGIVRWLHESARCACRRGRAFLGEDK